MSTPEGHVLVTGGLGFIGLNLVAGLVEQNWSVRVLSRSADPLAVSWLDRIRRGRDVEVVIGDIADASTVRDALSRVHTVMDLAGESGAARSVSHAFEDMAVNVAGHLTLLEAARDLPAPPRIVFFSSRLVYGVTGSRPVDETAATRPTSFYGIHKLTVEHYCRVFHEQHGVPTVVLRLTNPYGPYQHPARRGYGILNRFVMAALRDETIQVFGSGDQLRDYVYVEDVTRAAISAMQDASVIGSIVNVGLGRSVALSNAAATVVALAGSGRVEHVPWPSDYRGVETGDFACDVTRLTALPDARPEVDLATGLERTISAYRELLG